MTVRPVVLWITLLAVVVALIVLLREILLPFVAGMGLAYLLDPLASRLERLGLNRLVATLAIMALFMIGAIALVLLSVPIIVRELAYFLENVPHYLERLRGLATDQSRPWLSKIVGSGLDTAQRSIGELTTLAFGWFDEFLLSAWSGGRALISVLSLTIVAPVIACYLVYDWNRMIAVVDNWVPPRRRDTARMLAHQIDDTIGGYVRGQSALCLILAMLYAVAFSVVGLNHALLIGAAAGLISFVPYFGSFTAMVISTGVALAQFWPRWGLICVVPGIIFVGQSIADYMLAPYLIGRRVNLNPVWIVFALFAFGYLFGFFGLLIAVPLAAAIGVLVRFALKQYYVSQLYIAKPLARADEPSE